MTRATHSVKADSTKTSGVSNDSANPSTTDALKVELKDVLQSQMQLFSKIGSQLMTFADVLVEAADELCLTLCAEQLQDLLLYLDKLLLWNKAYNLTAISNPQEALIKHIIDCLAIVPNLPEGNLLDIGTGAGLPAVVIAICQPNRACYALDSNQKKIRFIRQMVSELKLNNLTPIASRIENHEGSYQVIVSRAFASLTDFVNLASPYLAVEGYLCAMKGKSPYAAERSALAEDWYINIQRLAVPRLNETRHLIELQARDDKPEMIGG